MWQEQDGELTPIEFSFEVTQGDATNLVRLELLGYPDITSSNWVGSVYLKYANLTATQVLQKSLSKANTNDAFTFWLTPEETLALPAGWLSLFVVVENLVDYPVPIKKHVISTEIKVLPKTFTEVQSSTPVTYIVGSSGGYALWAEGYLVEALND